VTASNGGPPSAGIAARVWARDTTLWTDDPDEAKEIAERLGWLDLPSGMTAELERLSAFAERVRADGIQRVLVCGMGGSSLCVEVLASVLGPDGSAGPGPEGTVTDLPGLPVRVLDSTHPRAVADALAWGPPETTLYVIASKSGTTTEPNDFAAFFEAEAAGTLGGRAGSRFVAITDPGTPMVDHAHGRGYRETFLNPPDIGGRYSALSLFGLVPAALLGIDLDALLARARNMAELCGAAVPDDANPGVLLGSFLGRNAAAGRDKVTILTVPELSTFGLWAEQLLAESTGKQGKGLLPVVGEPPAPVEAFGHDRAVVAVGLAGRKAAGAAELAAAGHPVHEVELGEGIELGAEFLRWELATAVAGHLLGINAFDQPDVQAAKDATKRVLAEVGRGGGAPPDDPEAVRLGGIADIAPTAAALRRLLDAGRPGEYVAVMAYVNPGEGHTRALAEAQATIRDATRAATTIGFGPRFLHSTGQLHKGGPNTGRFLQLTDVPRTDLEVPGRDYTFGTLIGAQAAGDREALAAARRRLLHLHLTEGGTLEMLNEALRVALGSASTRSPNPRRLDDRLDAEGERVEDVAGPGGADLA
jgi:glucose-6-phosphate isomerase